MSDKPPPSLRELALLQCIKHANQIVDVGNTPYHVVKPLLAKLSVDQLVAIETQCPHIYEKDDELWSEHIARGFKDRKLPKRHFRDAYFAYCRDKEAQLGAARERLKLKQEQYNEHKRATSIVALSEAPVQARQPGSNNIPFRSRGMQSVAKRMHTSSQLRRPQRPQTFVKKDSFSGGATAWAGSPPTSPAGSPPSVDFPTPAASPPPLGPARSASPTKRPTPASAVLAAKRKRVSSVFMPRKQ